MHASAEPQNAFDGAQDARAAKHALLLDVAAREFNARGIAGASIGRIAKAMGLTRAAVYYYVKDRDALAAQCYRRRLRDMAPTSILRP